MNLLELRYFGNEDGVTDKNRKISQRYSADEKAAGVRMLTATRAELRTNRVGPRLVDENRPESPDEKRQARKDTS